MTSISISIDITGNNRVGIVVYRANEREGGGGGCVCEVQSTVVVRRFSFIGTRGAAVLAMGFGMPPRKTRTFALFSRPGSETAVCPQVIVFRTARAGRLEGSKARRAGRQAARAEKSHIHRLTETETGDLWCQLSSI